MLETELGGSGTNNTKERSEASHPVTQECPRCGWLTPLDQEQCPNCATRFRDWRPLSKAAIAPRLDEKTMRWVEEGEKRRREERERRSTANEWGTTAAVLSAAVPIILAFIATASSAILVVLFLPLAVLAGAVGYVVGYVAWHIIGKVRHRRIQSALAH